MESGSLKANLCSFNLPRNSRNMCERERERRNILRVAIVLPLIVFVVVVTVVVLVPFVVSFNFRYAAAGLLVLISSDKPKRRLRSNCAVARSLFRSCNMLARTGLQTFRAAAAAFCSARSLSVCCRRSYATLAAASEKSKSPARSLRVLSSLLTLAACASLRLVSVCVRACVCLRVGFKKIVAKL